MEASAKTTKKIHNECSKVFTRNGCFKGTFSLHIKDDVKPYQVLPRHVAYAPEKLFKKN